MRCPNCAMEIIMDAEGRTRFCPNCGYKLPSASDDSIMQGQQNTGSFNEDLIQSKTALGEGRYEDTRRYAESAISKNVNSPDAWYLKACSVMPIDHTLYIECLTRAKNLNATIPFIVVNPDSAKRMFDTALPNDSIEGPTEELYEFAVNKMNYLFSKNGSVYNSLIDGCINEIRMRCGNILSNPAFIAAIEDKFNNLDRQLTFSNEYTVDNWAVIERSVNETIPHMFACFALNLSLGRRLATAIKALYNVTNSKCVSMFRPAAIKSLDVKMMAPVITRAKIYYDWAKNIR